MKQFFKKLQMLTMLTMLMTSVTTLCPESAPAEPSFLQRVVQRGQEFRKKHFPSPTEKLAKQAEQEKIEKGQERRKSQWGNFKKQLTKVKDNIISLLPKRLMTLLKKPAAPEKTAALNLTAAYSMTGIAQPQENEPLDSLKIKLKTADQNYTQELALSKGNSQFATEHQLVQKDLEQRITTQEAREALKHTYLMTAIEPPQENEQLEQLKAKLEKAQSMLSTIPPTGDDFGQSARYRLVINDLEQKITALQPRQQPSTIKDLFKNSFDLFSPTPKVEPSAKSNVQPETPTAQTEMTIDDAYRLLGLQKITLKPEEGASPENIGLLYTLQSAAHLALKNQEQPSTGDRDMHLQQSDQRRKAHSLIIEDLEKQAVAAGIEKQTPTSTQVTPEPAAPKVPKQQTPSLTLPVSPKASTLTTLPAKQLARLATFNPTTSDVSTALGVQPK